jgi:SAM-dependent methyltransferase
MRPLYGAVNRRIPGRRPRWGNLRRVEPFSVHHGFDRGRPVDLRYIENFLAKHREVIRGDVLEVRDSTYSTRFAAAAIRTHVIDVDPGNRAATIVGDLCQAATLNGYTFDCIILTQTLQFLAEPRRALQHLYGSLRPGGSMLVTVPSSQRIDREAPAVDFWRYTPAGLDQLLRSTLGDATVHVEFAGNLLVTLAAMLGLAEEELLEEELERLDAIFPVIACAAASKPAS